MKIFKLNSTQILTLLVKPYNYAIMASVLYYKNLHKLMRIDKSKDCTW